MPPFWRRIHRSGALLGGATAPPFHLNREKAKGGTRPLSRAARLLTYLGEELANKLFASLA